MTMRMQELFDELLDAVLNSKSRTDIQVNLVLQFVCKVCWQLIKYFNFLAV